MESLADFWHENITTYDLSRRIDFFFVLFCFERYCVEFPGLKEVRMCPRWASHIL